VFAGILIVELTLIVVFYIVPQFEPRNAPAAHWEMETPLGDNLWLPVVLMAFLGLFTLGNIGLVVAHWQTVKDLKTNN
jgi:hypothetical protein